MNNKKNRAEENGVDLSNYEMREVVVTKRNCISFLPCIVALVVGVFLAAVAIACTELSIVLITLIALLVIQCIENYVLQPIIMSKSIKISPILIITGLLVFGRLFGVFGMILSTPFVAMIKVIIENMKPLLIKYKKSKT